jgi:hypothetical protein
MFNIMTVFMDPGGPAISCIEDRLKVIFFCSKMGHGAGSGSPDDSPLRTDLNKVLMASLLTGAAAAVAIAAYVPLVMTSLARCPLGIPLANPLVGLALPKDVYLMGYRFKMCGIYAQPIATGVVDGQIPRVTLDHLVRCPMGQYRVALILARAELAVPVVKGRASPVPAIIRPADRNPWPEQLGCGLQCQSRFLIWAS